MSEIHEDHDDSRIAGVVDSLSEEVESDAVKELARIHDAKTFRGLDDVSSGIDSYGISSIPYASDPFSNSLSSREESMSSRVPTSREAKTLEDLYSLYPQIGDGSYYLRVIRKQPTMYNGLRISGFLDDVHGQISMSEFVSKFGGGTYEVSVRGPGRTSLDADGMVPTRTLSTLKIEIPGKPVALIVKSEESNVQFDRIGLAQEHPQVAIRKLELEREEKRRREEREAKLQDEIFKKTSMSPNIFKEMEEVADKRAQEIRSATSETIMSLREMAARLQQQLERKDELIQKLREEQVRIQMESSSKMREEETRQIREIKERYESDIARIKDDQARTIERMTADYKSSINDINSRHTVEREMIQKAEKLEKDRIREDSERRERQLIEDARIREQNIRDNYESRLSEMSRSFEREMLAVREQRDREIESIRSSESSKVALSQQAANLQIDTTNRHLEMINSELNSLRRENDELRSKLNKDTFQVIQEAHQLASLTGFGREEKVEEELDWKKGLFGTLRGLVEKAPEIVKNFSDTRESNRQALINAQVQAQMQAQARASQMSQARHHQQQQQHRQLPGPVSMTHPQSIQNQQRRPQGKPRMPSMNQVNSNRNPWGGFAGPPEPGSDNGLPVPMDGPIPYEERKNFVQRTSEKEVTKSPLPPPLASQEIAPPNPVSPIQPENISQVSGGTDSDSGLTEESVAKFVEKLDLAISTGIVPPQEFAHEFVKEVGPEVTKQLMSSISPDQLVDAVSQFKEGKSTSITTRDGRKYVENLWTEASKIVQ